MQVNKATKHLPLTMNQSLAGLHHEQRISLQAALEASPLRDELTEMIQRGLVAAWETKRLSLEEAVAASPDPSTLREMIQRVERLAERNSHRPTRRQ